MLHHPFDHYKKTLGDKGKVRSIKLPIITVQGLEHPILDELVLLPDNTLGQIFAIDQEEASIVLLEPTAVTTGTLVVRTNVFPSLHVGEELLGHIINPFGKDLYTQTLIEAQEQKLIDIVPSGIQTRTRIKQFFPTGVTIVDLMIPLGKGQKELIIGDRKTGKSSFALTTMKRHNMDGTILIYVTIGKKASEIKSLEEKIHQTVGREKCIIVATTALDSPGMIYLTPFTGMTIAEYFRDQGKDVLLILDDLSTHAKFYRETSLVAKNFPGRDSYPGDIFYTHARLLERAGNFLHPTKGEVAITCFPIVETIEGDLTGFLATNVMGITDGHIFFDSDLFYKGRRPGINPALSVSRVGRQTQTSLARACTWEITSFLSNFTKIQNVSHFGSELKDTIQQTLREGNLLYQFFHQNEVAIVPEHIQLLLFALIHLQEKDLTETNINHVTETFIKQSEAKITQELFSRIFAANSLDTFLDLVKQNKEQIHQIWQKTDK